jgi:hypothetical protein
VLQARLRTPRALPPRGPSGWRFERDDTIADEDLWYRTVVGDFTCTICQAIELYGFDALALFDRERPDHDEEE